MLSDAAIFRAMRLAAIASLLLLLYSMNLFAQSPEQLARIWDEKHITKIAPSDVRHSDLKNYLEQLKKLGLKVDEVGRSLADREIYQVEFGHGPFKVFMWSQMHGDEPTATSALIDMLAFFQTNRDLPWVKQIEDNLTIRTVPMLNPDGAELYQRRNLQSIDINRDARDLQTPEGRLLKKLRDDWSPSMGFNLHNQGALTTVGRSNRQATISLLVVYGDAAKTSSEGLERNKRVVSAIVTALQSFIPQNIAEYSDAYTATAFGDNFTAWGTPVILIETGALYGKDEMYLVKLNFVAFLTALRVLADGSEKNLSTEPYNQLRGNSSGALYNTIFRGANIVGADADHKIYQADIAVNAERRRASYPAPNFIREIGDLSGSYGTEEYSAGDFYVVQRYGNLKVGELAELLFYKKDRQIDWNSKELEKQFPPDAIFSTGKWFKGDGVVPRR